MRELVLSLGIPLLLVTLLAVHGFVNGRLPVARKRGWLLFVIGFVIALTGGGVAVYLNEVDIGGTVAWFGGMTAIAGMVWFFASGARDS